MENPRAVYVLSGDPITLGHMDVIKRARRMFSPLRVAIGNNPAKKYTFTLKEREELARRVLAPLPDIEVTSYEGLTVDYARLNNIPVIIRSARNTSDFNYERMLHEVNVSQELNIETVMLFPRQPLTHISSSAVKELQKHGGQIHQYVPLAVKEALERKVSDQLLIGWTGTIGAGKSYLARKMEELAKRGQVPGFGRDLHNIDVDSIGHEILTKNHSPMFIEVRKELMKYLGSWVCSNDEELGIPIVNVKTLGSSIFSDPETMQVFNDITRESMLFQLRQSIKGKRGVILVNSALIAEAGISYICNNNVVLISADLDVREKRLQDRGYDSAEIHNRISSQWSYIAKKESIERCIENDGCGRLFEFDNSHVKDIDFEKLYTELLLWWRDDGNT